MPSKFSKESREMFDSMPEEVKSTVISSMLDDMSPEQIEMTVVMIEACEKKGIELGPMIDGIMDSLECFETLFGAEFPMTQRSMALSEDGTPVPTLILTCDDVDSISLLFAEREKTMIAHVKEVSDVINRALGMAEKGNVHDAIGYMSQEIAKVREKIAEQSPKDNG